MRVPAARSSKRENKEGLGYGIAKLPTSLLPKQLALQTMDKLENAVGIGLQRLTRLQNLSVRFSTAITVASLCMSVPISFGTATHLTGLFGKEYSRLRTLFLKRYMPPCVDSRPPP